MTHGIRSILPYLKPYKKQIAINIVFNLLSVVFSLVSLAMVVPFLRLLFDKQLLVKEAPLWSWSMEGFVAQFNYQLSSIISQYGPRQALLYVCLLVVVLFFLKNVFHYGASYVMATLRNGVVRDIRQKLYDKLLRLPIGFYSDTRKGDILTRATADLQEVEWGVMSVIQSLIKEPVAILLSLLAMFWISPMLTLFVLIVLPGTGIIIGRVGKSLKKQSRQAQDMLGALMSTLEESLNGLRVIQAFGAQEQQRERFAGQNETHYTHMRSMLRRRDLSSPLTEFLSIIVIAIVLYVGGLLVLGQDRSLSAETFIAFIVIFSQILPPAKAFTKAFYHIQKGMASMDRVNELLQAKEEIEEMENPISFDAFKQSIRFDKVRFAYEPEQPVLHDISFELQKGKVLALVGASGSGKSTIADLLLRFYDVPAKEHGLIRIDETPIRSYDLKSLRARIGIVTQRSILFNDTIAYNIAMGKQGATQAEIERAAQLANASTFINNTPQGMLTTVGDNGSKLSGGERQRITIARAILKDPDILILDEATASLDAESEKAVQDALHNLMRDRTTLVIAHRLSTIQAADEILVLDKGRIIERGDHQALLALNGRYKRLVELQELASS